MSEKLLNEINNQIDELRRLQQANLYASLALNPYLSDEARLNFTKDAVWCSRTVDNIQDVLKDSTPSTDEQLINSDSLDSSKII